MGGPGDPPRDCPPCKIIIDGGRLAAAARWYAKAMAYDAESLAPDAANYLAAVVTANEAAISRGIKLHIFDREQIDEAHAWSELQCHRAQALEDAISGDGPEIDADTLYKWATEDREHATRLTGGEYHGGWTVNGTEGITKK